MGAEIGSVPCEALGAATVSGNTGGGTDTASGGACAHALQTVSGGAELRNITKSL